MSRIMKTTIIAARLARCVAVSFITITIVFLVPILAALYSRVYHFERGASQFSMARFGDAIQRYYKQPTLAANLEHIDVYQNNVVCNFTLINVSRYCIVINDDSINGLWLPFLTYDCDGRAWWIRPSNRFLSIIEGPSTDICIKPLEKITCVAAISLHKTPLEPVDQICRNANRMPDRLVFAERKSHIACRIIGEVSKNELLTVSMYGRPTVTWDSGSLPKKSSLISFKR